MLSVLGQTVLIFPLYPTTTKKAPDKIRKTNPPFRRKKTEDCRESYKCSSSRFPTTIETKENTRYVGAIINVCRHLSSASNRKANLISFRFSDNQFRCSNSTHPLPSPHPRRAGLPLRVLVHLLQPRPRHQCLVSQRDVLHVSLIARQH